MKKMKKACAALLAVLSVSLLTSAFAGEDNLVRWQNIVGNITVSNNDAVAGFNPGTTPWSTNLGRARVNLATGLLSFDVDGLVLNGGNATGTPGPVTSVTGTLVCNAGTGTQTVFNTAAVPLSAQGDAQFSGHFASAPGTTCSNPVFLIRIAVPAGAGGRWIATGAGRTP